MTVTKKLVKKPNAGMPRNGTTSPCCIIRVKIISIEFMSDHKLLKDHNADWTNGGSRFSKPEWTQAHKYPISHTMDEQVEIKVKLDITSTDGSTVTAELLAEGADGIEFKKSGYAFKPGTDTLVLKSNGKLTKKLRKLNFTIRWQSDNSSVLISPLTTQNVIYVTMGTPVESGVPEDGVTIKRMEQAIKWLANANTLEPIKIVERLFNAFPIYVLGNADKSTLEDNLQLEINNNPVLKNSLKNYGFSAYQDATQGGAWALSEYYRYGGECQAIVRLIKGMLHQTGAPGVTEVKYVNADASAHTIPVIKGSPSACTGPDSSKVYALADEAVKVGELYKDDLLYKKISGSVLYTGAKKSVGFNNFEAYLKFTHGSKIAWFGGGAGMVTSNFDSNNPYDEKKLITVFEALVECVFVVEYTATNQFYLRKITKVWNY